MQETAKLYWLTGLAGAGKTTIAKELQRILQSRGVPVVLFDGDEVREALQMTGKYSLQDRQWLAKSYAGLSRLVTSQGVHVICATISPFPEVRTWLRENVPGYVEVYVRTSNETVKQRDQKQLYSRSSRGEVSDVVGLDIPFSAPELPDIVADNDSGKSPHSIALTIANFESAYSC